MSRLHTLILRKDPLRFLLHCIAALLVSGSAAGAGNAILIGQAIDLSGPDARIGRDYVAGIKTYFDALNAGGGINGRRIVYIARDDRGVPEVAATSATELLERDHVDFLLGGVGDAVTKAVLETPAFKRSGLMLYAPLTQGELPIDSRVLFWRPGYRRELHHILAHFASLGMRSAGIAYRDSKPNRDAHRSLVEALEKHRMQLAGSARIDLAPDKLADEARRLAASRPGFILVIGDTLDTALFLKTYRKFDARTFVAGTSLTDLTTLRELAGPSAVEWTVFSQVVPSPAGGTSLLQVEHLGMMKKFRDEAASALTLEGFAAAKTLAMAIRHAKRGERQALQDYLADGTGIDIGGLLVAPSEGGRHLSAYLDVALFKKGGGLMF